MQVNLSISSKFCSYSWLSTIKYLLLNKVAHIAEFKPILLCQRCCYSTFLCPFIKRSDGFVRFKLNWPTLYNNICNTFLFTVFFILCGNCEKYWSFCHAEYACIIYWQRQLLVFSLSTTTCRLSNEYNWSFKWKHKELQMLDNSHMTCGGGNNVCNLGWWPYIRIEKM